ncbi:MAG: hypothetical protein RLY31_668 [Bacteroidota bacterium]|jgi:tetratricopeptide (TPR) repeat protein
MQPTRMTNPFSRAAAYSLAVAVLILPACTGDTTADSPSAATPAAQPADAAIADLTRQLASADGPQPALLAARAARWLERENYDEAIADLEAAIAIDSSKAEYFHVLADAYMDYFKSRKALHTMERAGSRFPDRIPTLLKLAEFQLILKQHQQALFTLERIRLKAPLHPEMFYLMGDVYLDMDRPTEAILQFQSAVEQDPDLIDAWVKLGTLLADRESPQAEKYFDNALRVDSNSVAALHAKAFFLSNVKNDLPAAVQLYRKINILHPQYVDGFYNLGLIYMDMDSLPQAYERFHIAIQVDPTLAGAYYHRGLSAEKMGNAEQALSDYRQTLLLDPDYAAAKAGLSRLSP